GETEHVVRVGDQLVAAVDEVVGEYVHGVLLDTPVVRDANRCVDGRFLESISPLGARRNDLDRYGDLLRLVEVMIKIDRREQDQAVRFEGVAVCDMHTDCW